MTKEFDPNNMAEDEFTFDEEAFDKAFDQEYEEINAQLLKEVHIAMIGDINTGKSSTINQIMGVDVAPTGAQPGETVQVQYYHYKDKIIFADTPGLDDIKQEHSEATMKFYKEADIVLFFLNAAGTVLSEGEKKNLDTIAKLNPNILLVLNKIDAADDVKTIVKYVKNHTDNEFQIIPTSSRTSEGIDDLRFAMLDMLEKVNKEALMSMHIEGKKNKAKIANRWINTAAVSAAGVGAIPIPGSDFVPLTTIQVGLMIRLATLYDKPMSKKAAKEFAIATVTGNIGKTIFRQVVKIIPGAGSVAAAGVAGSMTYALGQAVKYAYENDLDLDMATFTKFYQAFRKKDEFKM